MKIWLSKNSEIAIREQIVTQIKLGITSGDLAVGEKLPSTQEISRRFQIHSNTVSNAYQNLAENGLIEFKKGSGFYVCEVSAKIVDGEATLDSLIAEFLKTAQSKGFSKPEIQNRLQKSFSDQVLKQIVLIESDKDFQEILIDEIRQATGVKVCGISFEDFRSEHTKFNANFAAMSDEENKIQSVLPPNKNCIFLKPRSVSASMTGETRPEREDLIAIVSGWEKFLFWAKTILIAANIESESLIIRSTKEENWKKGLKNTSMIICDSLTAKKIPQKEKIRPFYLISDESLKELQNLAKQ
jgi:DNA-binding transcriptional regulator YhcF (GntR family)